jgi:hypothetical protein
MADNRPMRRQRLQQGGYSLQHARGHEFQNDQAHDLPLSALSQTPRNVFKDSTRIYRDNSGEVIASVLASASPELKATIFAIQRKANFTQLIFPYTTATQLILPQAARSYFLIQNLDTLSDLYVGFGFKPDGINLLGLKVVAGSAFEPYQVPQNDVFIAGSGSGLCTVLFAIG